MRVPCVIQLTDTDNALRTRQEIPRIASHIAAAVTEVFHLARQPATAPRLETAEVFSGGRRCNAGKFKSAGVCQLFDSPGRDYKGHSRQLSL
jgi:hypothetical protein